MAQCIFRDDQLDTATKPEHILLNATWWQNDDASRDLLRLQQ